ncbi:hypothetical protein LMG28614_06713 [Paraburkholderia ultramafica]|uniref:Uncharacterized protein n=1 Tax=Paraburkholderia ultramafica TaxID=1544867 RepID=A0A6S7BQJ7_9BURK|nr:hypothetical protein LMG28614_06713 [Paraburkholderia ultramafica]
MCAGFPLAIAPLDVTVKRHLIIPKRLNYHVVDAQKQALKHFSLREREMLPQPVERGNCAIFDIHDKALVAIAGFIRTDSRQQSSRIRQRRSLTNIGLG